MRSPVYHPPVAHDDSIPGPGPRPTSVAGAAAPRPHPDPADARTVEQLLYRYAEAIDDGDFAGVVAAFDTSRHPGDVDPPFVRRVEVRRAGLLD